MKHSLIIFITVLISQTIYAQDNLVIENSKSHNNDPLIIYAYAHNYLTISVSSSKSVVSVNDLEMLPRDAYKILSQEIIDNKLKVGIVVNVYNDDQVQLSLRSGEKKFHIDAELREMPDRFYAALNRSNDTVVYKSELLEYKGLLILSDDMNYRNCEFIQHFTAHVETESGLEKYYNYGPYFSPETKNAFKNIKRGSKVYFDDFKTLANCMPCRWTSPQPFSITVL